MLSTSKIGGAGGAAAPDANFSAVTMLLHGDGTNGAQNNTFIDSSTNNFTITRGGNVTQGTFSPYTRTAPYNVTNNGGSGYFDGTGDYLNTPATGQFAPAGDFTVSCWYYPTNLTTYNAPIGNYTGNNSTDWLIEVVASGAINFYTNGASIRIVSSAGVITTGAWHYISMSRSGSTITGYVNGVSIGTYTQSGTFGTATKNIYIGMIAGGTELITGYLSDVKLIDGSAITTVPTAPQTATTGTKLLLNFTNAGIYDHAMLNDLETVGNAQVSTSVVKFGTGSMYFDGTDDCLVPPANNGFAFGTGDFTIEFWINSNNVLSSGQKGCLQTSGTAGGFQTSYTSGVVIYQGGNATGGPLNGGIVANVAGTWVGSGTASITTGAWYHIALVRSSGVSNLYVNGTSIASNSTTGNCTGTNLVIGGYYNTSYTYNGYMDDLRITKGYARYTSNFTAPTAAFSNN